MELCRRKLTKQTARKSAVCRNGSFGDLLRQEEKIEKKSTVKKKAVELKLL